MSQNENIFLPLHLTQNMSKFSSMKNFDSKTALVLSKILSFSPLNSKFLTAK